MFEQNETYRLFESDRENATSFSHGDELHFKSQTSEGIVSLEALRQAEQAAVAASELAIGGTETSRNEHGPLTIDDVRQIGALLHWYRHDEQASRWSDDEAA